MRILIVEDEVKIREGMTKLISAHTSHKVIGEAGNGQEGLDMILRFHPDLVITDIRMPKMDGLEMLRKVHEMKIHVCSVILSGYSEFDYAKQAIHYGVEDYLLKPLAAEDIQEVLRRVEDKLEQEAGKLEGKPGRYIRDVFYGEQAIGKEEMQRIISSCQFSPSMGYQVYCGYVGDCSMIWEEEWQKKIQEMQERFDECRIHFFSNEFTREQGCLIAYPKEEMSGEEIKRYFERKMVNPYKIKDQRAIWAMIEVDSFEELYGKARKTAEWIKESLSIEGKELLTEGWMKQVAWQEFQYPLEGSQKMKWAICNEDSGKIQTEGEAFVEAMRQGMYRERDVRQSYLKAIYLLIDTVKEIDKPTYEQIQNADLISMCSDAVTLHEMEDAYRDGIKILINPKRVKEDISNYTIKRAINYIREHYQEGITLEEVAGKLGITPEYLSILFNRETDVNFSAFLRRFRISHAKRLLKGTDLKIYEIAEQVGYNDSKYFARVFKEELGISPVDYRQME